MPRDERRERNRPSFVIDDRSYSSTRSTDSGVARTDPSRPGLPFRQGREGADHELDLAHARDSPDPAVDECPMLLRRSDLTADQRPAVDRAVLGPEVVHEAGDDLAGHSLGPT